MGQYLARAVVKVIFFQREFSFCLCLWDDFLQWNQSGLDIQFSSDVPNMQLENI